MKFFVLSLFVLTVFVCSCEKTTYSDKTTNTWADTICNRAINIMGYNPQRAIGFLDSAFATKANLSNEALWRKYVTKVNFYQHYDHNFSKWRIYVDSMLLVTTKDKDALSYQYSHSLFAMAMLLQEEKKYNEAFQYYYTGRNFAAAKLDHCSSSEFNNALGVVRYRQKQYKQALPYFRQALSEVMSCQNSSFKDNFVQPQSILNSIALCFEKSAQLDSSIHYYRRALTFVETRGKKYPQNQRFVETAKAVIEGNLGGVLAMRGEYAEAEKYLVSNIRFNDRPGFAIEDSQTAKIKLAHFYIQRARLKEAKALVDQVGNDLETGRGKSSYYSDVLNRWYLLNATYYEKTKEIKQAFYYAQKFHQQKDSLEAAQQSFRDLDVDQLLYDYDQRFKLDMLNRKSELKTVYLASLSIFLVMAICIAAVIAFSYKRSRANVRELTVLNVQMKQALSALENSHGENTRLMKIVAHDLRGPIGAISMIADIMAGTPDRDEEDLEWIGIIQETSKNSLGLVNSLMHLNDTADALKKEPVDIASLIRQCVNMLEFRAKQKSQQMHLDLFSVELMLNYEKMWRVVSNLLSNAIKFSPESAHIFVKLVDENSTVALMITDEGIGIPQEVGNSIFDLSTNLRRKGTAGEESFGLGLSIVKQIVEAHNATISFTRGVDRGTTFCIRFNKITN